LIAECGSNQASLSQGQMQVWKAELHFGQWKMVLEVTLLDVDTKMTKLVNSFIISYGKGDCVSQYVLMWVNPSG